MKETEECPKCGKDAFHVLEIPQWKEEKLEITLSCWDCDTNVEGQLEKIPNRFDRTCVACQKTHRPLGRERTKLCEDCSHKIITFDCGFGIVIPKETGVVFRNQTSGVMCANRYVEGVKIRFRDHRFNDLMSELASANYNYDHEAVKEAWEKIDEKLWIDYERVESPEGEMSNTEAFQWIKITGVDEDRHGIDINREELVGKTVAMHYQNCD